jgi:hypothetical protein
MGSQFCPKCGTPRVGTFRFCRSCQFNFDDIDGPDTAGSGLTTPKPGSTTPPPDAFASKPETLGQHTADADEPVASAPSQPPKGRSAKGPAALVALVSLALCAVLAVSVLGLSSRPSATPESSIPAATQRAGVITTPQPSATMSRPSSGIVRGPGFEVWIPVGYSVVNDGTDGSQFFASLGGAEPAADFVVVYRETFDGSLDEAVDHYRTVIWEGKPTYDLGEAQLSGVGAKGEHLAVSGLVQGSIDAYVFVHHGQLWELRISTDDLDRGRVAAAFRFTD